jgi:urease accessory protein
LHESQSSAKLCLEFDRPAGQRATVLRVRRQDVPWRVVRGFVAPTGETLALLSNVSGGVLDSDDLEVRIDILPSAWAQVSTTGATRLYRSRGAERCARSVLEVHVGEEGYLEYLPDAVIPFAGSRCWQSTRIHLAPRAAAVWWELVAPGREAFGEVFRYERLSCTLEVIADGALVAQEIWDLEPSVRPLNSPVRLGPFRYFATLYACRCGVPATDWRAIESELERVADDDSLTGDVLWGASLLPAHGVVVRGAACSGRLLARSLIRIWRAAKWAMLGRGVTMPRKIY